MSAIVLSLLATASAFALEHWLPALLTLGFGAYARKYVTTKERAAFFESACRIAYGLVANLVALTPTQVDDKAAKGLLILADLFRQAGLTVTQDELALAKQRFDALHGEERSKAATLAKTLALESAALAAARAGALLTPAPNVVLEPTDGSAP